MSAVVRVSRRAFARFRTGLQNPWVKRVAVAIIVPGGTLLVAGELISRYARRRLQSRSK
jgi:hypothetical protein